MNLRQRYRIKGRRRVTRFLLMYSLLVFFLLFYSTFARYTTVVEDAPNIEIANWEIKINENKVVDGETLSNIIQLIPNATTQTTTNNKLAPGQNGYFDITINPEGTEVSIEYLIELETSNLPKGLEVTTYEILETGITKKIENNNITGEINLSNDIIHGFKITNMKTIRVYWSWKENEINSIPTGTENYNITATITVKQKLA